MFEVDKKTVASVVVGGLVLSGIIFALRFAAKKAPDAAKKPLEVVAEVVSQ